MQKITTDRNWREVDQLDGKDLRDGEYLRIMWPDGTYTNQTVKIESSSYNVSEQGQRDGYDVPVRHAMVPIKYRGQHTYIRITGLNAKRIDK